MLYVRERLRRLEAARFVEFGAGEGALTRVLLRAGWHGAAYDLNPAALEQAAARNREFIRDARLRLECRDWLLAPESTESAELVVSSMVLEHLSDDEVSAFLGRAARTLVSPGRLITIVPACPDSWEIEDEVAGHLRRYTRHSLTDLLQTHGWYVEHLAGLTFPVSNLLLRASNRLIDRFEGGRRELTMKERTVASGSRSVPWKTSFPPASQLVLNPVLIYPLHLLQKLFRGHPRALVLYSEASLRH